MAFPEELRAYLVWIGPLDGGRRSVAMLKAMFDETQVIQNPVVPNPPTADKR